MLKGDVKLECPQSVVLVDLVNFSRGLFKLELDLANEDAEVVSKKDGGLTVRRPSQQRRKSSKPLKL